MVAAIRGKFSGRDVSGMHVHQRRRGFTVEALKRGNKRRCGIVVIGR